ncbi:MAG: response regulator [Spirochaetota bacterium]|nr:response regulator [Spirochaetota bacterium]
MKIFTISQASKYCKVTPGKIVNWIEDGSIIGDSTIGGHRRIKKDELDRYLKEQNLPAGDPTFIDSIKKILVVDDDKIVVETIVQALEEDDHGYELMSAADGFESTIQVKHFKPDLMILDIKMPDINGYEVCKKIKSDPETKETKIIILSAYLDDDNKKQMMENGADACFAKPLPLPNLKQQVAILLGL